MKRLQGFIAGIFVTLMLTGIFAVAKNMYEKIDVLYNDIKIQIDGEEFIAKDVNGNVVEPFIYNGTTFLPVRAIATAFDKEVAWNDETYTVSLTTKEQVPEEAPAEKGEDVPEDVSPEYGNNLTDELLHGVWYADVTSMLSSLGVPGDICRKYKISATYRFGEDAVYEIYLSEEAVDTLVDAAFEYALVSYGITAEEYPMITGISIEETKDQIKTELDISGFFEKGTYRVENGVLYMLVEGNPEKVQNYTLNDNVLTLYEDEAHINLTRTIDE